MEKNKFIRSLVLSALAFSSGQDSVTPHSHESPIPRIAKAAVTQPVPLEEFNLPALVIESPIVLDSQPTLALDVSQKEPDRVMEELTNKETGEILENVQIEIYYEEKQQTDIWGFTIPIAEENTAISVDLILPEIQNPLSDQLPVQPAGHIEENLIILEPQDVETLTGESGQVAIVLVQNHSLVDEFNRFPNGGAFEGQPDGEVAVKISMEVSGTLYSTTESLPQH